MGIKQSAAMTIGDSNRPRHPFTSLVYGGWIRRGLAVPSQPLKIAAGDHALRVCGKMRRDCAQVRVKASAPSGGGGGSCDPSSPTVCIQSPPPDLDCPDVLPLRKFVVGPPDPHGFDGDHDGRGCES
jgi:hypothetical protein